MRLETSRLVIRSFEPDDGEAWVAILNDPLVRRFLPPFPDRTIDSFNDAIEQRRKREAELGYTMWAVALKSTGALVGQCGLNPVEGKGPEVEVAYHFAPASWNNGYATEAVGAILDYALGSKILDRVIAIVMPENIGSQRVAEKAGMRFEGVGTYYGISDFKKYVAESEWWSSRRAS